MAEALGRNPCLCLYPREQPAQILCARNVPLSLGQSAHGACAQLLHRRCFGQGQENAGLQRPAPHRLGRLRPACRKRCHQAQYPPCQLDLFQHCQHARPDEAPWLQLRLGKRARHLPSRILPLGTALLHQIPGKGPALQKGCPPELVSFLPHRACQRTGRGRLLLALRHAR